MPDREKVIKALRFCFETANCDGCPYEIECRKIPLKTPENHCPILDDILSMLKEQENKRITSHKKHIITWNRNNPFSAGELYEAICKTLFDEGELFIERIYKHEKVDCVFYVADRR